MPQKIVLASGSEIRAKLLAQAAIPHEVIPAQIDEEMITAALRAEAAHRLWVAAHEVANPGVVTAMVAAARGGADEACRASGEAVRFWLRAMLLERYADSLLAAGFDTMERVALMEEEDLQAVFKMVQSEPSLAEAAAGRAPPPRKGRMRMPPGHARQLLKAVGQIRRLMDEADIEVMAEAADPLGLG